MMMTIDNVCVGGKRRKRKNEREWERKWIL